MRAIFLAVSIVCAGLSTVAAQSASSDPASKLPPGPLIKPAPSVAQWTAITRLSSPPPPPDGNSGQATTKAPERRVSVIRTKNVRREDSADGAGGTSESWKFEGYAITFNKSSNIPIVLIGAKETELTARQDFPGFEWISAKNFTGITKVRGRDCLSFRGQVSLGADQPELEATAIIDLETRLPLSLVFGEETTTYQFYPPPAAELVLPEKVKQIIADWKSNIENLQHGPARPY